MGVKESVTKTHSHSDRSHSDLFSVEQENVARECTIMKRLSRVIPIITSNATVFSRMFCYVQLSFCLKLQI